MGSKWNQWQSCKSGRFVLLAHGSLTLDTQKEGTRKNSSWEEEGINTHCQLIGQWVTDSLGRDIDLRKEIDLWLQQSYNEEQAQNCQIKSYKLPLLQNDFLPRNLCYLEQFIS